MAATVTISGCSIHIAGGPGNNRDWVGLFPVGAANSAYLSWVYLTGSQNRTGASPTSGTVTLPLPSQSGAYEIRFLSAANLNVFALLGKSSPFMVSSMAVGSATFSFTVTADPQIKSLTFSPSSATLPDSAPVGT